MKIKLIFCIISCIVVSASGQDHVSYVDPLIGTAPAATISALRHSESVSEDKGQTFPAVGRPFGMTQWTPETRTTEIKCISPYYYNDKQITGFRGSHWMSGSCTQDYGSMTIMPFTSANPSSLTASPSSSFSHANEIATPAYYRVFLDDYQIEAELTGSVRSGIMRFTFPGTSQSCLCLRVNSDEKQGYFRVGEAMITGCNPVHRIYQGNGKPAGFSGWFILQFDKPFTVIRNDPGSQKMIISFGNEKYVTAFIGTSFTSAEAAIKNLEAEVPDRNFDILRNETTGVWNNTLGKVKVKGGTREDLVKFYTALYHCYQLPRITSDISGSYQGFAEDTAIYLTEGFEYYDDFSMWDTYRALHPLMTILEPDKTSDMMRSLVLKAEQGGWMPIFPAWASYTAAMIGDHVSTTICDAFIKGIRVPDAEKAYRYMRRNAFETPPRSEYVDGKGRRALESYMKYGYIPLEDSVWDAFHKREQVSRTLEYAFDDYALSGMAKATGNKEDYKILKKRSLNYRNVFDSESGYVRGRHADGTWYEPFDPNVKARFICEGTPFQYTWYVPHDVPGLIRLMGGRKAFLSRLDEFFNERHYWHGNETDQQAPFMYAMAGDLQSTGDLTLRINDEEYGTGPGGLSGNEDAGQMSAWLVFSMMGFYPVCPASGEYILTYPAFEEIKLEPEGGRSFTISTSNAGSDDRIIRSVAANGRKIKKNVISHSQIIQGGEMVYNFKD
ncbi:MAG TPA: GH92 family glycosyl hydrolase [Bacteroidales bacterium]|nr:GH92 family glycosyl hydrolase [Bacteroidales bacterium]HPJ58392.1 GH92 family glycosyl hydrolase [Bacteroidales bacterium]HPR10802.1 GH92 family glycosyl hydrolase [Bacteroidales bacterium]HRW85985.1 GH92 family glycosyl hydrolase [Bacteroidales bacterium]